MITKYKKSYQRGKRIFRRLERRLKARHQGKVIAIEPSTGDYVIGKNALEAALKAKERFPGKTVDFFRIGFSVVHKFRPLYL